MIEYDKLIELFLSHEGIHVCVEILSGLEPEEQLAFYIALYKRCVDIYKNSSYSKYKFMQVSWLIHTRKGSNIMPESEDITVVLEAASGYPAYNRPYISLSSTGSHVCLRTGPYVGLSLNLSLLCSDTSITKKDMNRIIEHLKTIV